MLSSPGLRTLGASNLAAARLPSSRRIFSILFPLFFLAASLPCFAQTNYYVDPDYAGGTRNGNASNPWRSLSDTVTNTPWGVINAALASGPVNVYFSARKAASNTNQTSTVQLSMQRTNGSANVLTLDGISQYNTNASAPSWTTNVTPTPSNWQAASKFQITNTTPFDANASAGSCKSNIVFKGFRLIATEGQVINGTYLSNFTIQFVEGSRNNGGSYGPGVIVGPGNGGPGCGGSGPANVSVLNNYIHNTWGECLYIGATQPDPTPVQSGAPMPTGDNYLVQGNQLDSCATAGGQGDGIDIKDGHTNLRVIGNVIRPKFGGQGGGDGHGILVESGSLLDGNYIESPDHDCISIFSGWNNPSGRSTLDVRNNICVNVRSGNGHNNGIDLQGPNSGVTKIWSAVHIYNNTIFNTNDACIYIEPGYAAGVATVENNIMHTCLGGGLSAAGGELAAHDYNAFFNTTGSAVSYIGSVSCASVTSSEPHSLCADPQFVSTSTPYVGTNFKVQASSPVIAKGVTVTGFSSDYFGMSRPAGGWDIGASEYGSSTPGALSITPAAGTPQTAPVNTGFGTAMAATVRDANGNPVSGVSVTFTAPASGPSGTFGSGLRTETVTTDANGLAIDPPFTANATTGTYTVTATVSGAGTPANFTLTNTTVTPPGCVLSSASWQSQSIPMQTGSFTAAFDATPSTVTADGVIGLSSGIAAIYTDLAVIVRFNTSGSIDVMNNTAYASDTAVPYTANTSYHFRLVVSMTNHTYSVYVTPQGGTETQIATNYVFRNTQAAVTSLSYLSSATGAGNTTICNVLVSVAAAFDFSLSNSGNLSITQGSSGTKTITASLSSGTTQAVSFSVSGLPTGVTSSFLQTSCNPTCSSTLTLNATSSTAAGNSTITVTATSGSVTHTTNFTLTVNGSASAATITATAGTTQSTTVNTSFATAPAATVKNASNNPVSGVAVTFTAPSSGGSGTFTGGLTTATAATNSSGVATAPTFTANGTAGTYTVTATVSGVGAPANFNLTNTNTADTTPPTVSMTAPAASSAVSGTVTVSANASDNVGIAGVQFKLDGVNLGSEARVAPYSVSWNTATVANGMHSLTAVARDAAGNQATSVAISITVNNSTTTPVVTSATSASTTAGIAFSYQITATNSPASYGAIGLPAGLSINSGTGLISGTPAAAGTSTVTLSATNSAGTGTAILTLSIASSGTGGTSGTAINLSIPDNGGKQWIFSGNSNATLAGYADVQMNNAPSGIAFIEQRVNGVLVAEAGVPASPPTLSGRIYMNLNGSTATGIAFGNPSSQDSVISFYFTDTTGSDFGSGSFVLPANHQIAVFLDQSPFNVRTSTGGTFFNNSWSIEGTFTFNSSIPVGAVALQGLINERGEFLYTTVPVAPVTGTNPDPVIVPHFADGGGWTTQVLLINPSDRQITGTAQFYSQGSSRQSGQPVSISVNGATNSTFNYAIPPHTAVRLTTDGQRSRTQSGSVWITPSAGGAPTAAAIFSFVNNGITVTEATVGGLSIGTAFRTYAEVSGTSGQIGSIQTGVAIANPSPNSITVNLEVRQMDGSSLGSPVSVTVPGNGQIAKFMGELISTLPANFHGFLKVTSTSPIAFNGLRATVNERGDFLITTTTPRNDGQVLSGSDVIFPQVVSGGGYTTQLILFGPAGTGTLLLNSQGLTLQ